jgi:hypothetical protein
MEKRINKKIESYVSQFKDDIKDKVSIMGLTKNEDMNKILQFIFDYERLELKKDDFMKRKRVKNVVNLFDRCCAKRANGEQCTRRKKDEDEYCGTHLKGTPHGIICKNDENKTSTYKVEVWAQDIQGIIYYVDNKFNVYQTEDIISNKINPKIIAKYVKSCENYSIPDFGI